MRQLRSKRELIEKFIQENLPEIRRHRRHSQKFDKFWNEEQQKAFQIGEEENLSADRTEKLLKIICLPKENHYEMKCLELIEGEKPSFRTQKS
jgi:type I restriction enzyme R subunit